MSSLPSLAAVAKKKGTPAQGKASAIEEDADADNAGLHDILRGCRRVVVIGVHGWCPNSEYAWRGKLFSLSIYIFRDVEADWGMLLFIIIARLVCLNE